METKAETLQLLQQYVERNPNEQKAANEIISFVGNHEDAELFDRKNFTGHITASAFIINENKDSLLLLKHKFLNRWLQPGGHVDYTDSSLIAAAKREAEEETGLGANELRIVSITIFDIDNHLIPVNIKKQELSHTHHDIRFLFQSSQHIISIADEESTGSKWVPLEDLAEDESFGRVARKIRNGDFCK
jgi:8-oxo-dGTP pyrophosphatase MutT (NUDIX family)